VWKSACVETIALYTSFSRRMSLCVVLRCSVLLSA
jgi:hypothetical protein